MYVYMYIVMYISDDTFWNRLIDLINCSLIESTEHFRTSGRPVHWSGSRTTRTEIILESFA